MVQDVFFLAVAVKNPCPWVRDVEQTKKRGLLYFILCTFISVVGGKGLLPHGVKKVGIQGAGVVDLGCVTNQGDFFLAIVVNVGFNPQGEYVPAPPQPGAEGNCF